MARQPGSTPGAQGHLQLIMGREKSWNFENIDGRPLRLRYVLPPVQSPSTCPTSGWHPLDRNGGLSLAQSWSNPSSLQTRISTPARLPIALMNFTSSTLPPGSLPVTIPIAERYRLQARAQQERIFISRLRPGRYRLRGFAQERIVGVGGDIGLVFASMPGEVRYIGRLLVEVPQRVSRGKEYRFTVENAREAALTYVSARNPELAKQAVDAPMRPQP